MSPDQNLCCIPQNKEKKIEKIYLEFSKVGGKILCLAGYIRREKDTKLLKIQNSFKIATSAEAPIMVKLDS